MKRAALSMLSILACVFCCQSPVFAGTTILECQYRLEVDNSATGTPRSDQARLGRDEDGFTDRRVWAEFDISSLAGKTVTGIGFRVYNNWTGTKISDLRYCGIEPTVSDAVALKAQHNFNNKYSGFLWSPINANNAWTPGSNDFFRPNWSSWKRNGTGTTIIQDVQAHIDGNKGWFAVEFDCFQCLAPTNAVNLRFPDPDTSDSKSIVMEVKTNSVDLGDAIIALQVTAGLNPASADISADANNDGKIGIEEAINALQKIAEVR